MGEIAFYSFPNSKPRETVIDQLVETIPLAPEEDPIETCDGKKLGCAFWRGEWHQYPGGNEGRMTAREFGHDGPGYCFFEMRHPVTKARTSKQDWYLNWRKFKPSPGMRLIADYRVPSEASKSQAVA